MFTDYTDMKLLVWLWNPWVKYAKNRHNAGFLMIDDLLDRHEGTEFLYQEKYDAAVATCMLWKWQCIAIKPMWFYNVAGKSVQKIMNFYKIAPEDCLILHDDIDLAYWVIKLKFNWSHWWNNWVRDIYERTWSDRFWKVKYGIGRPEHPRFDIKDRVLSDLSEDEIADILREHREIDQRVMQFLKNQW